MTIVEALDVFVAAFSQGKSATYPYLARDLLADGVDGTEREPNRGARPGGDRDRFLTLMADAPGRKDPRKSEVVCFGFGAGEVVERARAAGVGWHFACAVHAEEDDLEEVREDFKANGYRSLGTERLFVHDLKDIPEFAPEHPIRDVDSWELALHLNALLSRTVFSARDFKTTPYPFRQYGMWDETRMHGRVRSVPHGSHAWVSDLYVDKTLRGKGHGKALMCHLLKKDRRHGVDHSVLLASTDGSRVYPKCGYRQLGVLQIFCPVNRYDWEPWR